jgi:hypothetical protein
VVGSDRALALNVEREGPRRCHTPVSNSPLAHFNAFTRIANVPNPVPWRARHRPTQESPLANRMISKLRPTGFNSRLRARRIVFTTQVDYGDRLVVCR